MSKKLTPEEKAAKAAAKPAKAPKAPVVPTESKIPSAKKHVTFHLHSGHTRKFHEDDHGAGWKDSAAEFAVTNQDKIAKTEVV